MQYKAVCFSRQPNNSTQWRNVHEPLQLGKNPRPLDGVLVLRDQPLGEILVEPLQSGGNAEFATSASENTPLLITDNLPDSPLLALHFTAPSLPS